MELCLRIFEGTLVENIVITHDFHGLTFARLPGSFLSMRPLSQIFKHLPRNSASVNAMNKCVIIIFAYFT